MRDPQVPNAAWRSFLVEGLGFGNLDLGLIGIAGSLFSSCGLIAYKRFFMGTGWRKIYMVTSSLTFFFSMVQLLLIFRVNRRCGSPEDSACSHGMKLPHVSAAVGRRSGQDVRCCVRFSVCSTFCQWSTGAAVYCSEVASHPTLRGNSSSCVTGALMC